MGFLTQPERSLLKLYRKKTNFSTFSQRIKKFILNIRKIYKDESMYCFFYCVIEFIFVKIALRILQIYQFIFYKITKSFISFTFQGESYAYFVHNYNRTWENERAIEIPIIWRIVNKYRGKRILEVGNVLSHYFSFSHDILDKYDKVPGVMNQDLVDFIPGTKYDLIVTISTLEHIGWDENPRNPMKTLKAIEKLKSIVAPGGKIIITIPLGYNIEMDKLLGNGGIVFTEKYCMKRVSRCNIWKEVDWNAVAESKYNSPFNNANSVVIGLIKN